jgi:probable F420-dependent oxidoreductase
MRIGVSFPQQEATDSIAIRDYVQAVEGMGFQHLVTADHVVGFNQETSGRNLRFGHRHIFHEPFVLLSFIAGVTQDLELVTAIVILPQRQTALVAKQAAELDYLSDGRVRLGVAVGWSQPEYEVLGEDFHTRGRRIDEQIAVLRALWTQELVTFEGRWHHIEDAGLNPMPVQRPIPLWLGGSSEAALRRVATVADGWLLVGRPQPEVGEQMETIRRLAREAGRDPARIGLEGAIQLRSGGPEVWRADLEQWQALGATHVTINSSGAGLFPDGHIEALRQAFEVLR